MMNFEFFNENLDVKFFSRFSKLPMNAVIKKLQQEFNKYFDLYSRLSKDEYLFLCKEFFLSENDFKKKIHRDFNEYLNQKEKLEISEKKKQLLFEFKKKLLEDVSFNEITKIKEVNKNFCPNDIKTEFINHFYYKLQDEDSVYVAYNSQIKDYTFIKILDELTQFSPKPLEIHNFYNQKEAEFINKIPTINLNLFNEIKMFEVLILNGNIINNYFHKVINSDLLIIDDNNLKRILPNLLEDIKKLDKGYLLTVKETEHLNFFDMLSILELKNIPNYYK